MTAETHAGAGPELTAAIAARVESFVREVVIPYESDPRRDHHGAPTDELVTEMRELARRAGVLTPHILTDGRHLNQRETAVVLEKSGLSPLGPLAVNTAAPDEGASRVRNCRKNSCVRSSKDARALLFSCPNPRSKGARALIPR